MGNNCKYEIWCDIVAMDVSLSSFGVALMAIEIHIPLKLVSLKFVRLPILKERTPKSFKEEGSNFLIFPNRDIR